MKQELLDELVTAAQEVVNDAEYEDLCYVSGGIVFDRLKAVVKAISADAIAGVVAYAQETRGEPVNWEQIEAAVGHPFSPEEREKIAPSRGHEQ